MPIRNRLPLALILILTAVVFGVSLLNGFVNLDDPLLVTENPRVQEASLANVAYVFTHFDPELYIPVTLLSYQLETWILGGSAWHYHLTAILLHLLGISLVYAIARRLSQSERVAVITAALFAVHPLNAEAVLWVSARKDLLSGVLALASLLSYLRAREGKRNAYAWSLGLFLLALGSKVSVVTLPLLLIGYEAWNGTLRKNVRGLAPFIACSLVFGVIAVIGKTVVASTLEPASMLVMVVRSLHFYLASVVAPGSLAAAHVVAPASVLHSPLLPFWILTVGGASALAFAYRKRFPLAAGGFAFFLIAIGASLLHYTQGNGTFVLGAERYAYLGSAGLFFAVAVLFDTVLGAVSPRIARFALGVAILFLLVLCELTVLRALVFRDAVIFNIDILQKHSDDARSWYNLGTALETARRPMQAELAYNEAIRNQPDFADAAINLGILFEREGRPEESLAMFAQATSMRPDYYKTHFNLGVALQNRKRYAEAEAAYRRTVELFPDFPAARRNFAVVLGLQKKVKESIEQYTILAEIDPGFRAELEALNAGR